MQERFAGIGRRIVVATHRRSGTHLALDLLRRQFRACRARKGLGEGLDTLYLNLDQLDARRRPLSEPAALERLRRAPRPLVKTHAPPCPRAGSHSDFLERLYADADVYAVVRDGRDVLCSLHAYVRSHDRRAPEALSEFLREQRGGASRVAIWARSVCESVDRPGVRPLAYEEIVSHPRAVLERLGEELGLEPLYVQPLLPPPLRSRWASRWGRLSRDPSATTIPARSPSPDWRRIFSAADREFFQREAGDVLARLGYESSDTWVGERAA